MNDWLKIEINKREAATKSLEEEIARLERQRQLLDRQLNQRYREMMVLGGELRALKIVLEQEGGDKQ